MINKINNTLGNYSSLVPGLYNSSCGEDCNCESCNPSEKNKTKTEIFIEKAKKLHGDKCDYSKVNYVNSRTKVTIICSKHGEFLQTPNHHLKGTGCPKCGIINGRNKCRCTLEEFIEKAKKVHGDKYNYSKVNYVNTYTKVTITCPKHGEFLQSPKSHLKGRGCPMCNSSHMEIDIRKLLINNNIDFKEQWNWEWLKYKNKQYVDFYLPDYNIAIECQGEQHFKALTHFGGEDNFKITQERDENKLKLCMEHGINILYYSNLGKNYPYHYNVITDINTLINEIKKVDLTNRS